MSTTVKLQETFREAAPLHFLFKIESFSLLSKNSVVKYESNEFETGGYKWKLSFYPDGNKNESGNDHISLYLVLVDSSSDSTSLSTDDSWELNVFFRLFLFDHIRDRYFIRGDTEGRTKRFHEMKKVWGFPQFVSLANFNDPSNGYLVDDSCAFGAEVFIATPLGNTERLSMVKKTTTVKHSWKIENFSSIKEEFINSEKFEAGDHNWDLKMYPKGISVGKNNSMSLFLNFPDCRKDPGLKAYTNFKLRTRDQHNGKHIEFSEANHWFCATSFSWGWFEFIGLDKMKNKGNGYLVNDTCIVEAEVEVLGVVSKRP